MKLLFIFLVVVNIQDCYHYGASASPTSTALAEGESELATGEEADGKSSKRSAVFASSSSSSSGPGFWTTMFAGPQTGGSIVSFSSSPFSSGQVQISKSESTSNGLKKINTHFMTTPSDSDSFSAQTGTFVSEEDEDIMPINSRAESGASAGVRTRLLGGSGSRSGLLGLGLGLL